MRILLAKAISAAWEPGKAADILISSDQLLDMVYEMGFRFVSVGNGGGMLMQGVQNGWAVLAKFQTSS